MLVRIRSLLRPLLMLLLFASSLIIVQRSDALAYTAEARNYNTSLNYCVKTKGTVEDLPVSQGTSKAESWGYLYQVYGQTTTCTSPYNEWARIGVEIAVLQSDTLSGGGYWRECATITGSKWNGASTNYVFLTRYNLPSGCSVTRGWFRTRSKSWFRDTGVSATVITNPVWLSP